MKKKSILTLVLSLVLVGTISVGATLAYLTSTDSKTNKFTVGQVNITESETGTWTDGTDAVLIPNKSYTKLPVVTVKAGSQRCDVYMKVILPTTVPTQGQTAKNVFDSISINSQWEAVTGVANVYHYKGSKLVYTDNKVANDIVLESLFNSVTVSKGLNNDDLASITNKSIVVKSFAIQSDSFSIEQGKTIVDYFPTGF